MAWNTASDYTGYQTDTITIPINETTNGMQFRVMIKDDHGNTVYSDAADVTMYQIVITTQPESISGNEGTSGTMNVVATGDGLTYEWQYYTED